MTTLLHLSTRHIGTHELSDGINRTTLYSFFSTLCLISIIILCLSFFYNKIVFPIITPPVQIHIEPHPKIPETKGEKKGSSTATKSTNGLIGKTTHKNNDTIPEEIIDTRTSVPSETDGDGSVVSSFLGGGGEIPSQPSYSATAIPEEEENEFEFIPEIEPKIDIMAIQKNVVYPQSAIRSGKEGTVVLKVRIDEKGNAVQSEIVSSTSSVFDQAALNAVEHYSTNPAMNNGKAVAYTVYIPIKFRLR